MEEASYLCDRLVVMDGGRILVEGSPAELVSTYTGDQVVEVHAPPSDRPGLTARLREMGVDPEDRGDAVLVYGEKGVPAVDGVVLDGYQVVRRPGNLEDVFLRLTGRGLREE
jgi:lipooligosaccharide transport system ATP-binding protein